jgi:two-component system response regulator FixJ
MTRMGELTIYIVDDDEFVRDSLRALLEASNYATAAYDSGVAFLDVANSLSKGCVLLDVRMQGLDGLEVQQRLRDKRPDMPVVIITGHGDVPMAVKAMKAGAVDFIEKPFTEGALLECVGRALATVERAEQADLFGEAARANLEKLTPREQDVLEQLVIGRPNKVIAYELGISPRTIEIHRARIMEKMSAQSISHLVRLALAAGVDPGSAT